MKILVVEDDRIVGQYVQRGLEEVQYHADLVDDGLEALRLISGGQYDLVVLDLRLPGMTGYEVLRKLREANRTLPAILMSGHFSDKILRKSGTLGGVELLSKPFTLATLRDALTRALGGD